MNKIHIKSDAKYIDIHHNDVVNVDISTEEPVSEELEEAAKINAAAIVLNGMAPDATVKQLREVAVKCFISGANWQKEQMMKDAVKVRIVNVANVASESQDICGKYFSCVGSFKEDEYCPSPGDKVKLIIVKED